MTANNNIFIFQQLPARFPAEESKAHFHKSEQLQRSEDDVLHAVYRTRDPGGRASLD